MKKKIWILNHFSSSMFFNEGGRHYSFAKYLKQEGYDPVIFCANSKHGNGECFLSFDGLYCEKVNNNIDVPFVFVKARAYSNNGKARILNMVDFYINVIKAAKDYAKKNGKPDIILASSVHPLTLLAGEKLARKYGVKCICEIRDLWPESMVAYGVLKRNSIITKCLYLGEKFIYKKADRIIMTWPGGYDYIMERGWDKVIPESKVCHISNGVDLDAYLKNLDTYTYSDPRFSDNGDIRFTYAGSIRKVNNLSVLIRAVQILNGQEHKPFKLYIFGDGDERSDLERIVQEEKIENVVFMGKVPKSYIPSVLSQTDINILHNSSTSLDKYGRSQNKFFEYLASGRPVMMTYTVGYSVVKEEKCGIEIEKQTPETIAAAILDFCELSSEIKEEYISNTRRCVTKFDFKYLTNKLVDLIESM